MKAYKVYKYTNKVNGKVYIGQTRQSIKDRAKGRGHGYKKCYRFASAIKHYGWDNFECEILHDNLTREEADELEIEYIKYYRDELGISYNMEDGGKSKGTHQNSEEVKRMISESMKGKNVGEKNGMYVKISPSSKKVYEYDEEFNLINVYDAIQYATKNINISHMTLSKHLYKHNLVRACGKIFSFNEYNKDDILNDNPYDILLLTIPKTRNGKIAIYQYDLDHNFIKEYKTTKEAIDTGLLSQSIIDKIREYPYEHNGYIWTRSDTNFDIFKDTKTNACLTRRDPLRCKINKYDLNGNYICSYEYMKDIKRSENITTIVINKILNHLDNGPWIRDNVIWTKYDNILKGDDGYKVFSVRIKDSTVEQLEDICKRTNRSRNEIIGIMLQYGIDNCVIEE